MPELPEVETIRRDISICLHDPIISVDVYRPSIFRGVIPDLARNQIIQIHRTGKLLQLELLGGYYLLVHLKMTGQLILDTPSGVQVQGYSRTSDDEYPNAHTAIRIAFASGNTLYMNDVRKFGYIEYVSGEVRDGRIQAYGIEPLMDNFTLAAFTNIFARKTASLKSILLNQKYIAGLGNIYVDEICFRAGIHPGVAVNELTPQQINELYNHTEPVIARAIELRGTTFRSYADGYGRQGNYKTELRVYGRQGLSCTVCNSMIQKSKVAGRGTHTCPICQPN